MVRRIAQESRTGQVMLPPGLAAAPVLDLMCTHFVLTLTQQQGAQFNLKRDLSGLLPLCGRHLVWPVTVLHRAIESACATIHREATQDPARAGMSTTSPAPSVRFIKTVFSMRFINSARS